MSSDTAFGFADEMRVGLRGMVRRVWGRRGVKVHQRVQMVYKWMYLFLVVDVRRGRLLWSWIDSMRSAAIAVAVDGLKHHSDIEALVWDGARGHRGEMVRSVGLATIIQPPYSPELNPAERVFQEVRRWVEGKTYGGIEEKMEAVDAYLGELESDPGRVRGYVNRCVNDIRRRPSQPLIQWRFHPHTVHRGRRLRSTQGPSDA